MPDRIETAIRPEFRDPAGEAVRERIAEDLGIQLESVRVIDVYTIDAGLDGGECDTVRRALFTDPVIQESALNAPLARDCAHVIEVGFRPGVTDNAGKSAREGVADVLGRELPPGAAVYTARQYCIRGASGPEECERIARELLANSLIERWRILSLEERIALGGTPLLEPPRVVEQARPHVREIRLDLDDEALMRLSRDMMLALDLREMQAIRDYYANPAVRERRARLGLPEAPADIELEILAQTWSEHCKHKIFAAEIMYTDEEGGTRRIDGLFDTYVKATTAAVAERVDWLVSVFHDNAGIIRFDGDHCFALKCETHNSPSALDPYGGAMTGIVGVNRDILGAGLGFHCIFNTDVFCFASPGHEGEIPERLLHPRRVLRGVHRGVQDGGNESGIPTVNGAFVFHERFLGKPLVFCGTGGIAPAHVAGRPIHEKRAQVGDHIVMAGGRIGKDGIHGATFSSEELHEGSPATAVQIGDPITQKKMAGFLLEARDLGLFNSITDNGAGGLSSSIGEMARDTGGAEVHLDRAPLKYAGLAPWEIFLSEAQERMTLAVPEESLEAFLDLARRREVEVTPIGRFTDLGRLETYYEGKIAGALDMEFLHDGVPRMRLEAVWTPPPAAPLHLPEAVAPAQALLRVLGALNVCSKENFVRMYDHEVQGQTVLKPFQGVAHDCPGDAAVLRPVHGSQRGIAIACGICPKYSDFDTYHMMACAIDEAVRNLIAAGAAPGAIAGLDNFCWPDPVQSEKTPDGRYKLAQLVRCCEALRDVCVAYGIPLISGKDSMKNDYKIGGTKISIPPTVLFTAAAIVPDVAKCVTMDVKRPGDAVFVLGETMDELGGSEYLAVHGGAGGAVPRVDPETALARYHRLARAIDRGLVASCHDVSDGGLAAALAESAFAGGFGMELDLAPINAPNAMAALFSESQSRFAVTTRPEDAEAFAGMMEASVYRVGEVAEAPRFRLRVPGADAIDLHIDELKEAWQQPLRW